MNHHTFWISDGEKTTTVSCTFHFTDYIQNSETDLHNSIIHITKYDSSPSWYDKGYQHISIKSFEVVTKSCNKIGNPLWYNLKAPPEAPPVMVAATSVLDINAISKTLMYMSAYTVWQKMASGSICTIFMW